LRARLDRTWNGEALEGARVGTLALARAGDRLALSWDLPLRSPVSAPDSPVGFTAGLWDHDVVELFLADGTDPERYFELEIGPHGHWLALAFTGIRKRTAELRELAPDLQQGLEGERWYGRVTFRAEFVRELVGPGPFKILFASCLGEAPDRMLCCSPVLPGTRPDFHQPARWADFRE
jgi:hypothetical protein